MVARGLQTTGSDGRPLFAMQRKSSENVGSSKARKYGNDKAVGPRITGPIMPV